MTAEEKKIEIAKRLMLPIECIKCGNCKHWGGNRGKIINSYGESSCSNEHISGKVAPYQFCKHFSLLKGVKLK